jgi:RNA polymerase sigma-70 factor (ECF subfamily)
MPEENVLIEKARAGDRDALNELVSSCWQPIFRFVSYKIGSSDEAQEITQETFFRAFRSLTSYQNADTHFTTYLGRIALNLITDFWRKKGRSPHTTDISDHLDHLSSGDETEQQAINHELRDTLAMALQKLPGDQRQVIELRIIAGISVKEAATAIGKSEAAVKMLQQRALKNLRQMLLDRGVAEI